MTHVYKLIVVAIILATPAFAQNPTDLSFVLATKSGVTTFRIGEEIDLEFLFSSQTPNRYKLAECYYGRRAAGENETFTVEPLTGTRDPLAGILGTIGPASISCLIGAPTVLDSKPIAKDRFLNEWIEFVTPGRYRISATTEQIVNSQSPTPVHLQSNAIEIEIVAPEPDWADKQAREAAAVLRASIKNESVLNSVAANDAAERAARTLRFLEAKEAVAPLVEFFATSYYSTELEAGLRSSPYRKEILSRLGSDLVAPDVPISGPWFRMLLELETMIVTGPRVKMADNDYVAQYQRNRDRFLSEISVAATQKVGQARVATLQTLLQEGGQTPDESLKRAFTASLMASPDTIPANAFLGSVWERWASPDAHGAVLAAARGAGRSRNDALIRLVDFSADEAREIVIERVRKGDYGSIPGLFPNELLMLPDETLPELDEILASEYEKGNIVVPRLISRYATEKIFPRIRDAYLKGSCGAILPYFYRVNPEEANRLRRESVQGGTHLCTLAFNRPVALSSGLEQAAIEDLASRNPQLQVFALQLLERGSDNAKEALLKAIELKSLQTGEINRIVDQLLTPGAWLLTSEEMNRLRAACLNQPCDNSVASRSRFPTTNIVTIGLQDSIHIGVIRASTAEEILEALRRFKPGIQFRLPPPPPVQTWVYQQRLEKARRAFEIAGIPLIE